MTDFARLRRWLSGNLETAQRQVDLFKESLDKEPAYALSWAGRVYDAAAQLKVYNAALSFLQDTEESVAGLRAEANRQVLQAARNPSRSTSPWSNEMDRCEAQAWAQLAEKLAYAD
jgi:hypothetical protein